MKLLNVELLWRSLIRAALVVAVTLLLSLPGSYTQAFPQAQPGSFTPDERFETMLSEARSEGQTRVIVGFQTPIGTFARNEVEITAQQAVIQRERSEFLSSLASLNAQALPNSLNWTIPFVALTVDEAALLALAASPEVTSIEPDTPEEMHLSQSIPLIGAAQATARGYDGSGYTVAILDTEVDASHPFLSGKVVAEACFSGGGIVANSYCPNSQLSQIGAGAAFPQQCINQGGGSGCSHGTHVAGIAAGASDSFHGAARGASIIGVNVFTDSATFPSDQISGLNHIYSLRNVYTITAVNMSLGGGIYTSTCDAQQSARKAAIDQLRSVNIATVISTGNDGFTNSISAPACISSAVSVGSTTKADAVSGFSNRAPFMTLFAPGSDITSSVLGNQFAPSSGTSMAAPHVTGAFAILRDFRPNATVTEMVTALRESGVDIAIPNAFIPRINVNDAINWLTSPSPTRTPTHTPTPTNTPLPPDNDLIANATTITTLPYTRNQSINGAINGGDPPNCGSVRYHTVWYRYTASVSLTVRVTTQGSNYDTVVGIYTGSPGSLTEVACNDDSPTGLQSDVSFAAAAGTLYYIQVGSFSNNPGGTTLFLNVTSTGTPTSTPTRTSTPTPTSTQSTEAI